MIETRGMVRIAPEAAPDGLRDFAGKSVQAVRVGVYTAWIVFEDGSRLEFSTSAPGPNGEHSMLIVQAKDGEG